jgi:hypothetical protein
MHELPTATAPTLTTVETIVAGLIGALAPAPLTGGRGRPRILPAMLLWAGLVVCVLRGWTSQRALWRLVSADGLWAFPRVAVTDQAIYRRLAQDGAGVLPELFGPLTTALADRLAPYAATELAPFAAAVVGLDETTLDPVARHLPALHGTPPTACLPGKLAGVFDLRTQLWPHLVVSDAPHQNEKVLARALVATLPPQSLVLADLGYFGFAWFDDLTDGGHYWVSRLRAKTSYRLLHVHFQQGETLDALVWLGAYKADRAKHAVRLVQYRHGGTLYRYLTNVRDPQQLPLPEVARLYVRRWDIELAVKTVKRELGLHLLWSAKLPVIQAQVWAVLLIAQLWQALRVELAGRAGVDPFEVSLPLLIQYLPQYAATGRDALTAFLADARRLAFIRPSRRTQITAPLIPEAAVQPPPPDLILQRTPRYAQRKCHPHPSSRI